MFHRMDKRARRVTGFYVSAKGRRALASPATLALSIFLASAPAPAAESPADADTPPSDNAVAEVIVTGVRHSEEDSINLKYHAASIQESISAEDIGKLPDVTISDSFQRITALQMDISG